MKLDAVQGFYQLPLDPATSKLTTFLLPQGLFRFKRGPMGLMPTNDFFCFESDKIFRQIPKSLKIVDDALLQAVNMDELIQIFRQVLIKCREHNLTLAKDKIEFGPKINFAGYIISANGVHPNPDRLKAIREFPTPKDLTDLRSFLGLTNQLGFFIPDHSHIVEPLRQLLKIKNAFVWTEQQQNAFDKIREVLTSDLLVKPFDPKLETHLLTDASRLKGLGYALIQRENDAIRLIQCGSRSLNPAESRYATIELECLAIVWACIDCRYFLIGCPKFTVLTDHRPLEGIFRNQLDDITNPRLLRFREKLTPYCFDVKYTPGKTHYIADALSRAPVFDPPERELLDDASAVTTMALSSDPALVKLSKAAEEDESYQQIIEAFRSNKHPKNLPPGHPARQFKSYWDEISLKNNLLLYQGSRIIVPHQMRKSILDKLHISHPGINRMRELAKRTFYWPGISSQIKQYVERCDPCQRLLASLPRDTLQNRTTPPAPMHSVAADLFSDEGKTYLVMVDRYSGMTFVSKALKSTTTAVITTILDKWFTEYGYPCVILTDGGPQFRHDFQEYCENNDIYPDLSSAYYPDSNGLAEAAVKSTEYLMRKSDNYNDFLKRHLEWKNVPTAGLRTSPAERFFGRTLKSALPRISPILKITQVESRHSKLHINQRVRIQDPISKRWDDTGTIMEIRESQRSYNVFSDSKQRLITRNRIMLRPLMEDKTQSGSSQLKSAPTGRTPSIFGSSKPAAGRHPPISKPRGQNSAPKAAYRAATPAAPLRRSARLAARV